MLAGKQYQGPALQAEIDRLAKDLGDEQQWTPEGDLPKLDLVQTERTATAAGTAGNLFATYSKAEPDKKHTYRVIAVNTAGLKSKPAANTEK